ncbi:hypothetical protein PF002_g2883 [Phytophthora fragariae]|uniref:Uncharacterized protein n=1 Tax=Phytophthora fragariae TaxID=53985 RepID=A0A6A4AC06_9STRA|nr:hypothetical protein PF002_g2883 [Phytophthora fragariae]
MGSGPRCGHGHDARDHARARGGGAAHSPAPLEWHLVQSLAKAGVALQKLLIYLASSFNQFLLLSKLLSATMRLKKEFTATNTAADLTWRTPRAAIGTTGGGDELDEKLPNPAERAVASRGTKGRKALSGWSHGTTGGGERLRPLSLDSALHSTQRETANGDEGDDCNSSRATSERHEWWGEADDGRPTDQQSEY